MKALLSLLGRPSLQGADGAVIALPAKAHLLAALLLIDTPGREITRESAARFLWEGAAPQRRSGNLRQLIQRISAALDAAGLALFVFEGDRIRLDLDGVDVDVPAFLGEAVEGDAEAIYALGREFRGELLAGIDDDGPELAQWLIARRERIRTGFVRMVAPLLDAVPPCLADDRIVFLAHRLGEIEPFEEAGCRALVRLHARRGDVEAAHRVYRRFSDALSRDLGIRPTDRTRTAYLTATRGLVAPEPATGSPETVRAERGPVQGRVLPILEVRARFASLLGLAEAEAAQAFVDECVEMLWRSRLLTILRRDGAAEATASAAHADYVLDAVAGRRGARAVVRLQLLVRETGEILWSSKVAEDRGEIAAVDVAEAVCRHVEIGELTSTVENAERQVHRLTLQGERWLRQIELPHVRRAKSLFRSAIALKADHARALAGMSKASRLEWLLLTRGDMTGLEAAELHARAAIAADPDDARGSHEMGICQIYRRRFDLGLRMLELAADTAPGDAAVAEDLADARVMSGLLDDGLADFSALLARSPHASDQLLWYAAGGSYLAARYREAIDLLDRMAAPDTAFHLRAACHAMLDERAAAEHFVHQMRERIPDFRIEPRSHMAPLRRQEDRDHFEAGLRAAGFDR